MSTTRTLTNGQLLTDWTEEVNDIANTYGLVNGSGLFAGAGTGQLSLLFDKSSNQINLLKQTNRNSNKAQKGADRKNQTFALTLPYFLYQDRISPADLQGLRMAGTPDSPETLANVIATKLEDMRLVADQTREYMKIQAMKGITVDSDGDVIANMFATIGLAGAAITDNGYDDYEVRFDLSDAALNPDVAIAELKRKISKGAMIGGKIGNIEVMVTAGFFDALVGHPLMREAYLHYSVSEAKSDAVRSDLATFEAWGVVDTFKHKGITFYTYDADFNSDDGDGTITVLKGIGSTGASNSDRDTRQGASGALQGTTAAGVVAAHTTGSVPHVGYTVIKGVRNLYKGVFGPANTLSGANTVGSEMMVAQYSDPKDKFWDMELEMANLYYMTRPQMSFRVYDAA
jgi:hypothetical protein